jgi:hypothetical protein
MKNLSQEILNLENGYCRFRELTGEILATLTVNLNRGTLIKNEEHRKIFEEYLECWKKRRDNITETVNFYDEK